MFNNEAISNHRAVKSVAKVAPAPRIITESANNSSEMHSEDYQCSILDDMLNFDDRNLDRDVEISNGVIEESEENDAERLEEEMLSMPPLKEILPALNFLKEDRRVIVSSLTFKDMTNPEFLKIVESESCEEVKLQLVRPKVNTSEWSGFLIMNFASTSAAGTAAEKFRHISADLDVKVNRNTDRCTYQLESWIQDTKVERLWTNRMLYVKNLAPSTDRTDLQKVFPSADDVIIRYDCQNSSPDCSNKSANDAFVIYRSVETTEAAANDLAERILEVNGHQLKVFKYHPPALNPNKGYLKLKERQAVLKYMATLTERHQANSGNLNEDHVDYQQHLRLCQRIIDGDDKARDRNGLSKPSLEELRSMPGIRSLGPPEKRSLFIRLGIIRENLLGKEMSMQSLASGKNIVVGPPPRGESRSSGSGISSRRSSISSSSSINGSMPGINVSNKRRFEGNDDPVRNKKAHLPGLNRSMSYTNDQSKHIDCRSNYPPTKTPLLRLNSPGMIYDFDAHYSPTCSDSPHYGRAPLISVTPTDIAPTCKPPLLNINHNGHPAPFRWPLLSSDYGGIPPPPGRPKVPLLNIHPDDRPIYDYRGN